MFRTRRYRGMQLSPHHTQSNAPIGPRRRATLLLCLTPRPATHTIVHTIRTQMCRTHRHCNMQLRPHHAQIAHYCATHAITRTYCSTSVTPLIIPYLFMAHAICYVYTDDWRSGSTPERFWYSGILQHPHLYYLSMSPFESVTFLGMPYPYGCVKFCWGGVTGYPHK